MQILKNLLLALLATTALTACIIVDVHSNEIPGKSRDYSTVNDDIVIAKGARGDDISSVNGDIRVGEGAHVDGIEAVNGDITLEPNATADSIESVNGDVRLSAGARITDDIEKVNGGLMLDNATVAGDVDQVNGELQMQDSTVAGNVSIAQVDVSLLGKSRILGNLVVEENRHHKNKPVIELGPESEIVGTLILKRDVDLRKDPAAKVGAIERRYAN